MKMAQEQGLRWQKLLQYEHEQRLYLEDMVEQLGKQHSNLEKQIRKSMNGAVSPTAHDTAGHNTLTITCIYHFIHMILPCCIVGWFVLWCLHCITFVYLFFPCFYIVRGQDVCYVIQDWWMLPATHVTVLLFLGRCV